LSGIGDQILRQSVRDYLVNQQFRCDVFSKGSRKLSTLEQRKAWAEQSFVLIKMTEQGSLKVITSRGAANLREEIYWPIIETLAQDSYSPKKLAEIAAHPKLKGISERSLIGALILLVGGGFVHPAQEPSKQALAQCGALNRYLCEQARSSGYMSLLVSPVSSCGVSMSQVSQLFLLAAYHGHKTPKDQASYVWEQLSSQGYKSHKELETAEQNQEHLTQQAITVAERSTPLLKGLGVTLQ
jgi:hypothetical protein